MFEIPYFPFSTEFEFYETWEGMLSAFVAVVKITDYAPAYPDSHPAYDEPATVEFELLSCTISNNKTDDEDVVIESPQKNKWVMAQVEEHLLDKIECGELEC